MIFRQYLSSQEIAQYSREFNTGLNAWLDGGQHDGRVRHYASLMEEISPFIASLADDTRFADAAEQLIGKDVLCIAVDGNYMVGDTQWHPDTHSLSYSAVKFCIYPDPLEESNGALRVIPGSHREPFHSQISGDTQSAYGLRPDELPAYVFESQPGDVLVFNVGLWHGAFEGGNHRRQGVVVYYEDPRTPEAAKEIKHQMQLNQQRFAEMGHQMYGQSWRSVDNPRHQRWIRRLEAFKLAKEDAKRYNAPYAKVRCFTPSMSPFQLVWELVVETEDDRARFYKEIANILLIAAANKRTQRASIVSA